MERLQTPTLSFAETRTGLTAAGATADYFALAYIQLCGISYAPNPADIPALVADPAQVMPWGDGRWACIWGPALDPEQANLVYVAAYYDNPTGLPVAAVAVTRGTDVTNDAWGDFKEAFEDLAVPFQSPLPWAPWSPARVADGTLDALTTIEQMTSNGVGLRAFLAGFLGDPANERPVLVVTGHSLGGCVTTVLAPWLEVALGAAGVSVPIVPNTFAAPTAGNAAFAAYFGAMFPYAPRYFNTLDMVPFAWADLPGIKHLYDSYGLPTPELVKIVLDGFEAAMRATGASYAQPACIGDLAGTFCLGLDWYQEIGAQHDHRTYIALIQGTAPPCLGTARPRIRRHDSAERVAALAVADAGAAAAATLRAEPITPA